MRETVKKTVKRNKLHNLKPFQKGHRPIATSEQKKAGWERKRQSQRIMDQIMRLGDMTLEEFRNYVKDKSNKMTLGELIPIRYMKLVVNGKLLKDYLDRHVGKAPRGFELDEYIAPEPYVLSKEEEAMIKARLEANGLSYKK